MSLKARFLRLADPSVPIPPYQSPFWQPFFTDPKSVDEVFVSLSPSDIRYLRDTNIVGFCSLLKILCTKFIILTTSTKRVPLKDFPTNQLLNCLRLLTRILPFLYESEDLVIAERELFWSLNFSVCEETEASGDIPTATVSPVTPSTNATIGSASSHFSSSNDPFSDDSTKPLVDFHLKSTSSKDSTKARYDDQSRSTDLTLGAQLVDCATKLLFTRGFTVPLRDDDGLKTYMNIQDFTVWDDAEVDLCSYRLEVLRFLLCLCSQPLYQSISSVVVQGSRYLSWLVTRTERLRFQTLLSSLIDVTCKSASTTDSESVLFRELNGAFSLNCIQLLSLMLVYPVPKDSAEARVNLARYYCGRLSDPSGIAAICSATLDPILRPISPDSDGNSSSFSGWMKAKLGNQEPSDGAVELLVLFWEFYQVNRIFRSYVGKKYGPKVLIALLYTVWTYKSSDKYRGYVRLSLYLILFLLSDNLIGSQLLNAVDKTFYQALPQSYKLSVSPTTYRDFLVCQLCNITCSECPPALYPTMIQLIYNLVPISSLYADNGKPVTENRRISSRDMASGQTPPLELSYAACSSIVQLIGRMSGLGFLSCNENNPDLLALLIRSLCHVINRVPEHSSVLLYVISKSAPVFERVTKSIRDVSERQEAQKEADEDGESEAATTVAGAADKSVDTDPSIRQPLSRQISHESHITITSRDSPVRDVSSLPPFTRRTSQLSSISKVSSVSAEEDLIESLTLAESELTDGKEIPQNDSLLTTDALDDEDMVQPRPPVGMSQKAKSKQPLYASLEATWPANEAIHIILQVIDYVTSKVSFHPANYDASIIVNRIAGLNTKEVLNGLNHCDEYNPSKTSFEPLRFVWSHKSLGWYEAVLWGCIYGSSNSGKSNRLLSELSSSITALKRVSAGWGFWGNGLSSSSSSRESSSPVEEASTLFMSGFDEEQVRNVAESALLRGTGAHVWRASRVRLLRVRDRSLDDIPEKVERKPQKTPERVPRPTSASFSVAAEEVSAGIGFRRRFSAQPRRWTLGNEEVPSDRSDSN
ncbi:DEKNAAC100955 [Brettanomyces naardenensis]|uniref:DEKNAAC100955 n=1 Tax=Brettanomyces naardenensis TaxID=13370 RepID=A0A448YGW0_BRENA|nr:DEKNAAC100955 [Brettanomyces naardenensis]